VNGVRKRALLKESAHDILGLCCLHDQTKGKEHEQLQKTVTYDLALRAPHRLGAKISVSEYMGRLKGKSGIRIFGAFRDLRQRRYWGNHFWAQGYCVGTVGLDGEMIWKYVKWQEKQEQRQEEFRFSK
jgi:hypothetical protein